MSEQNRFNQALVILKARGHKSSAKDIETLSTLHAKTDLNAQQLADEIYNFAPSNKEVVLDIANTGLTRGRSALSKLMAKASTALDPDTKK